MNRDPGTCKISVRYGKLSPTSYDGLMIALFQGENLSRETFRQCDLQEEPARRIQELIANGEIRGAFKEFTIVHCGCGKKTQRVIVMGLGKRSAEDLDRVRSMCAKAARTLRKIHIKRMVFYADSIAGASPEAVAEAAAEGITMGLAKFPKYCQKEWKPRPFDELVLLVSNKSDLAAAKKGARRGRFLGNAVVRTRTIINMPANVLTCDAIEAEARALAQTSPNISIKVHKVAALKRMNMAGLLNVGRAGSSPPRLIELNYKGAPKNKSVLALVGKGVIYDSGGLSIKPQGGGAKMKYDMAGAATMLGALRVIRDLKLPINVMVLLPVAENLIDREGYRCGDVLRMANGVCVEIHNTDAEGRLILADALVYASKKKVDAIIDAATLTGSVVAALGNVAAGVMGTSQKLVDRIIEAGVHCSERHWQLPLFPEYGVHIKSLVADINNLGGRPAQTSTAALFLKHFIDESIPWGHLDICGVAWIGEDSTQYFHKPYLPKRGATGFDVRTVAHVAQGLAEDMKRTGKSIRALLE